MLARALVAFIHLYQRSFGRAMPPRCRFEPTCSSYAVEAIQINGAVRGAGQAIWRIIRCAPWSRGGLDPVKHLRKGAHVHG